MFKKVELNGITKLMQEYIDKYSNYSYYHWVQQSSLLKGATADRFPTLLTRCNLKYIFTTCTSLTDVTLDWKDFVALYELVIFCE